jgi:hypothetical protein
MNTRGYLNCPYCDDLITVESRDSHVVLAHPSKWLAEQGRGSIRYADGVLVQGAPSRDSAIARSLRSEGK